MGSGNSGATNVFRLVGIKAALPVALFDFSKAFFPVYFSSDIADFLGIKSFGGIELQLVLLFFVLIGHVFPVWAGFRGGKAVASAAGGVSALFPPAAPVCLILFLLVAWISGYVSLASLFAAWFLPLFYWIYSIVTKGVTSLVLLVFFFFCALVITILHRKNIKRLIKGEENRFGRKKS